jgi:hypothetical protein
MVGSSRSATRCWAWSAGAMQRPRSVSRPSDVKSHQDTTGHNENKPAGPGDRPHDHRRPVRQAMKSLASRGDVEGEAGG